MSTRPALLALLRANPRMHVTDLAGQLLRACRTEQRALSQLYREPSVRATHVRLVREVSRMLRRAGRPAETVGDEELAMIARLLEVDDPSGVVAVRAVAEALDETRGHLFFERYRGRQTLLEPGDPVPVPPLEAPRLLFGEHLTTDPDTAEPPFDGLSRLRLCPDIGRYRVRYDARLPASVERPALLTASTSIGLAVPAALDAYRWDELTEDGEPYFYSVRPAESERHRSSLLELARAADAAGVEILVLPELSVAAVGRAAGPDDPSAGAGGCHRRHGRARLAAHPWLMRLDECVPIWDTGFATDARIIS
jgi:hypothetical protein